MKESSSKKHCDRCGAKSTESRLFRIPWTGDLLCKDCIDRDRSLQQMFAEINSLTHERRVRAPGGPAGLPDRMDMSAYILEPDDQ